jgi:catechol-2,3-dioxygenase
MNNKKRLHVHISVDNLEESIKFYNVQFDAKPTKIKEDYAQWLLEDMGVNFAISTRSEEKGLNHLGVQYESDEALDKAQTSFEEAGIKSKEEVGAICCYKESNKYWVNDPSGLVWENYHSMNNIEVYGGKGECCMTDDKASFSVNKPNNSCC